VNSGLNRGVQGNGFWIGKIAGFGLGFMRGGLSGAIIGALLGHLLDRYLDARFGSGGRGAFGRGASSAAVQQVFFETTFLVMGHLAKADGRVSEVEIQTARTVMHHMRLRPEDVKRAIDLFTVGKKPDTEIEAQVAALRDACAGQRELIRTFLEIQMELALSKGGISPAERKVLWRIADTLGVSRVELTQIEAVLRARRSFGQQQSGQQGTNPLEQAYKALGIESDASEQEVKKAYRRLMNQHHPDKLVARGLPDSMMEVAKERTREIRSAYETIKAHRGIK
jgi:DnaJ like chaperone protein